MAFVTTVHSLKANVTTLNPLRQHVPFKTYLHFQFKIGPQYSLTHSLSLSFSHRHAFGSYFIDFPFLYIFFWCTFSFIPYSVSGLLSLSFSLTYSYCFLSLIFCFSLLDRTLQACVILALHVPLNTKHISDQRLIMTCCLLYGFLICNHDIFVRHGLNEGHRHTKHINDQFEK